MRVSGGRRFLFVALVVAFSLAGAGAVPSGSVAQDEPRPDRQARAQDAPACLEAAEPNDALDDIDTVDGPFCLAGTLPVGDQDLVLWQVAPADVRTPWTISLEGVPGSLTVFDVRPIDTDAGVEPLVVGAPMLELAVEQGASGPTVRPDVLMAPGRYLLGVSAGGQPPVPVPSLGYRVIVEHGSTLQAAEDREPNDDPQSASPQHGAFSLDGDTAGSPDVYRWALGPEDAQLTWNLSAASLLGENATLSLMTGDGVLLAQAHAQLGRMELPDLVLAPGGYLVWLDAAATEANPYILAAVPSDVATGDPEPNDDQGHAVALDASNPLAKGRIARELDEDWFRFDSTGGEGTLDIRLVWASGVGRELCLFAPSGPPLQCRQSIDGILMPGLSLPVGEYFLRVSGEARLDDPYLVRLDAAGFGAADFELEPNDTPEAAAPFDPSLGMNGRATDGDVDVFRVAVEGEPQIWRLDAYGDQIERLDWIRADGTYLAPADLAADRASALITDLYLIPGEHWIRYQGSGGDYHLALTSLGPIDPDAEREPNDRPVDAESLRVGVPRTGRLPTVADEDMYRFRTRALDHLMITLEAPPDGTVLMRLSDGVDINRSFPAAEGETVQFDALLPVGEYSIGLSTDRPSDSRYAIRIERLDPFALAADQEPNETADDAQPLPLGRRIHGSALGAADQDWYALDPVPAGTAIEIVADGDVSSVLLMDEAGEVPLSPEPDGVTFGSAPLATDGAVWLRIAARGDYELLVRTEPGTEPLPAPSPGSSSVELVMEVDPNVVAAYWPSGQNLSGSVRIANPTSTDAHVDLTAVASDRGWQARLALPQVDLGPQQTQSVPFVLQIPPDVAADDPVRVTFGGFQDGGSQDTAFVDIIPSRDVPPIGALRTWAVPDALLGGLDVASLALGATAIPAMDPEGEARLHDGFAPTDWGLSWNIATRPVTLTVDLAGDEVVGVAGTIINPLSADASLGGAPKQFHLDLSVDGAVWETVLHGQLVRSAQEQAFVLDSSVPARFARLVVDTFQHDSSQRIELGEWKVVAVPGSAPLPVALNIAEPAAGGHVVWFEPQANRAEMTLQMLTPDLASEPLPTEPGVTPTWVLAFMDDRIARISAFEWVDAIPSDPKMRAASVEIAVSLESALGPWLEVGTWELRRAPDGSVNSMHLDDPISARFVRFTTHSPSRKATSFELPGVLRVLEVPESDTERSILGQWGAGERAGPAEWRSRTDGASVIDDPNDDGAASPRPLVAGSTASGRVSHGIDSDWYELSIPDGHRSISFALEGLPILTASLVLTDPFGDSLPLTISDGARPGAVVYTAAVEGGSRYLLEVHQPRSSIVFSFDTSASITGAQFEAVEGAVRDFAADLMPGRESVRILPFDDESLLDGWNDQPYEIQAAVDRYVLDVSSSAVEASLLRAADDLESRDGGRAILLVTDAASSSYESAVAMWRQLSVTRPVIFAVEVGGFGESPAISRHHVMQDLATSTGGTYDHATTREEIQHAFDRLATWLRRPAGYRLSFQTSPQDLPPREPGRLRVVPSPSDGAVMLGEDVAIELVLDTSGSMLRRLDGRRRIDVAKSVLKELVTDVLPAEVPVALRVFGDTPKSCETELAVPLGPLEAKAMSARVEKLDVLRSARTPLAKAIARVADDLAGVTGPRLVVVLSDGQESCGGNPTKAVEQLVSTGVDVRVNLVGLSLQDRKLRRFMQRLASRGHGNYFEAQDPAELRSAMALALSATYDVVGASGEVVATGTLGGDAVELDPGTYDVVVQIEPEVRFEGVPIRAGGELELTMGGS